VLVGSRPELVLALLAAARLGAAFLPIHLAYRGREIAHLLGDARPCVLIAEEEPAARVLELPPSDRTSLREIVPVSRLLEWAGEPTGEDVVPPARIDPDDLAILLYTSGTTGKSKGAMLSHGNVAAMVRSLHEAWAWSSADRLLLALPLFHLHGLVVGLLSALAAGATVLLEPRFDAERTLERLGAGEATLFFGVPTLYVRLVEALARQREPVDLSAVRLFVSGSAPLPPETFRAFRELAGQEILERYGMTETGMLFGNPLAGPRLPGTVGVPLPGVEARLVDAAGAPVPDGAEGEVEVRGPNVFSGYYRAPEKSAESFRADAEGRRWFRTGDIGRRDPESGHLSLLARRSELILSGGFNVYPREVEEVLLALPGVREAAVVGEPHPEFGESPVAFLVAERRIDRAELDAHCHERLAGFKRPRRYVFVDALPRNALGKVEKRRLSEAFR